MVQTLQGGVEFAVEESVDPLAKTVLLNCLYVDTRLDRATRKGTLFYDLAPLRRGNLHIGC